MQSFCQPIGPLAKQSRCCERLTLNVATDKLRNWTCNLKLALRITFNGRVKPRSNAYTYFAITCEVCFY